MMDCERCSNNIFDELAGEYYCEAPIDQDAWERILTNKVRCPFYVEDGEYRTVRKQN